MLRRSKRRRTAILLFVQSVKIRGLKSLFFIAVALSFYHPNLNPLSQKKRVSLTIPGIPDIPPWNGPDHIHEVPCPHLADLPVGYHMNGARRLFYSLGDFRGGDDIGLFTEILEFLFQRLIRFEGVIYGFFRKDVPWMKQKEDRQA